jgi:hypothetical protein
LSVRERLEKSKGRAKLRRATKGLSGGKADTNSRIKTLFEAIDLNANGVLQLDELTVYLGDDAASVVAEMDCIQVDGAISLDEWTAFFSTVSCDVLNSHLTQLEGIVASRVIEAESTHADSHARELQRAQIEGAITNYDPDYSEMVPQMVKYHK